MCGIIIYKGEKGINLDTIFNIASENKHRGSTDGFGIVMKEKEDSDLDTYRSTLHIAEVLDRKADRKKKEEAKIASELLKELRSEKIDNKTYNFIAFHHRMKSYGDVSEKNVHPFEVEDALYMHNGSVNCDTLKNFLSCFGKAEFKSETDTEVIATLVEKYFQKSPTEQKGFGICKFMTKVFPDWGVLVRIDKSGNVHIFKDESRELYLVTKGKETYIISEPITQFGQVDLCKRLKSGHFGLIDGKFEFFGGLLSNLTKEFNEFTALKIFNNGYCDCCHVNKPTIKNGLIDMCFDCYLRKESPYLSLTFNEFSCWTE